MMILRILSLMLLTAGGLAAAPGSVLFEQMKAQYQKDYGIELAADGEVYPVADSGGAITARDAGPRNVDMVLYFLRKEFGKYPAELIRASGLKRIVFCRDLKANGNRVAGVALEPNATIYMDSSTEVGDESHRRRTLHHEFFHFIDYALHADRDIRDNPEWVSANAPDTAYGSPETGAPVSNWASHPAPGFVSNYSRKAVPSPQTIRSSRSSLCS